VVRADDEDGGLVVEVGFADEVVLDRQVGLGGARPFEVEEGGCLVGDGADVVDDDVADVVLVASPEIRPVAMA
jgi:hypothetical protein